MIDTETETNIPPSSSLTPEFVKKIKQDPEATQQVRQAVSHLYEIQQEQEAQQVYDLNHRWRNPLMVGGLAIALVSMGAVILNIHSQNIDHQLLDWELKSGYSGMAVFFGGAIYPRVEGLANRIRHH